MNPNFSDGLLTEFIRLDPSVDHHGQPGASDSVPVVLGGWRRNSSVISNSTASAGAVIYSPAGAPRAARSRGRASLTVSTHLLRAQSATRANERAPRFSNSRICCCVWAISKSSCRKPRTGVSDVKKHPARLRGGFRSGRRGACCRSPRKGQAGRIREDL